MCHNVSMTSQLKQVLSSEGLKQSFFFTAGNLGAYAISAISLLLISRSLGPVNFGEYWVGVAFLTILAKLQTFGLPTAMQKLVGKVHSDKAAVQKIFQHSMVLLGASVSVGAVLGIVAATLMSSVLELQHPTILYGAVLCASITAIFEQISVFHQVTHNFFTAVAMLVLQALGKLGVAAVFLLTGHLSVAALFTLFYLVPVLSIAFGMSHIPEKIKLHPRAMDKALVRKFTAIVPHTVLMAVGLALMDYSDVFLLKKFTTTTETGLYGGVSQFALAIALIAQAVGGVLNSRVNRYHRATDLFAYLKKVPLLLVGAGVGFVAFLPFARLIVLYTLGESYLAAVPILVGLIAAAVIFAATIPLAAIMYIDEERSEYFSISTILMILVQVGGGFLLIPQFGVEAAVGVRVASRVVVFAYTVFAVLSFLRRKYSTVFSKPS